MGAFIEILKKLGWVFEVNFEYWQEYVVQMITISNYYEILKNNERLNKQENATIFFT